MQPDEVAVDASVRDGNPLDLSSSGGFVRGPSSFRLLQIWAAGAGWYLWSKQARTGRRDREEGGDGRDGTKKEEFTGKPENSFPQICVVSGLSVCAGSIWYKSTEGHWILVTTPVIQR
jgi:hypothetical protein